MKNCDFPTKNSLVWCEPIMSNICKIEKSNSQKSPMEQETLRYYLHVTTHVRLIHSLAHI